MTTKPKKKSSPKYEAPALDKGLDILELLASHEEGMSQSRIATELNRNNSEIFRMLARLEARHYVNRSPIDGLYRLTYKLFELAHRHPPTRRLARLADPIMAEAAATTGQSVHLSVGCNRGLIVIAEAESPAPVRVSLATGTIISLTQSVSGRVMLAFQAQATIQQWLDADLITKKGLLDVDDDLAAIRRQGFLQRQSFVISDITDLAAPIFDHTGHAVAVMATPFLGGSAKLSIKETCAEIVKSARALSLQLGGAASE